MNREGLEELLYSISSPKDRKRILARRARLQARRITIDRAQLLGKDKHKGISAILEANTHLSTDIQKELEIYPEKVIIGMIPSNKSFDNIVITAWKSDGKIKATGFFANNLLCNRLAIRDSIFSFSTKGNQAGYYIFHSTSQLKNLSMDVERMNEDWQNKATAHVGRIRDAIARIYPPTFNYDIAVMHPIDYLALVGQRKIAGEYVYDVAVPA